MFSVHGLDTLRLKPEEQQIVTQFLASRTREPERRRAARRGRFTNPAGLIIRVTHPGGTVVAYRIRPRDMSELGMGFLHGNFLYPGSGCRLDLRRRDGEGIAMLARVARCDHITGRVHDVGIEFNEPIDLALFADLEMDEPAAPDLTPPKARPAYWIRK